MSRQIEDLKWREILYYSFAGIYGKESSINLGKFGPALFLKSRSPWFYDQANLYSLPTLVMRMVH